MATATAYTAEDARRDFPQRLRRAQLVEMARRFGFTKRMIRALLERPKDDEGKLTGEPAAIVGIVYANTKWAYYDRDAAMAVLRV